MRYLLDTCVVSELAAPKRNPKVVAWVDAQDEEEMGLSVVTYGELLRGIERLLDSRRRQELQVWFGDALERRFEGRWLVLDLKVMQTWGRLLARLEKQGRPMAIQDSWIAATALTHDLVLVTRNVSDFVDSGVRLFDPWVL